MDKKRASWTENQLKQALEAIANGMSVLAASKLYEIPRRTLRNHISTGSNKRRLGRKSLLTKDQENELCKRIFRLAEVGMPLTSKCLRRSVFTFVEQNGMQHPFSQNTKLAGRKWMSAFYKRNPDVAQRKAQSLNPARAQKVNKFVVEDYFQKLKNVLIDLRLINQPQLIYNMDEKGCRLNLHHQQQVLAKKGTKRVHLIAPEHAENVTVVACGNAVGQSIPPMVLFKGKRQKPEWIDTMPPGTSVEMTAKGSMTTSTFIKWIDHFARYKSPGHCLLIFDGASSHLDANIVETANSHNITLLCLPSNTTHELQPLDKSVFRSFEHFWDEEVLRYWIQEPERKITKGRFGSILSAVWPKAMSPQNLMAGFRATGIYPFNPNAIPETAFAPSVLTERTTRELNLQQDNPVSENSRNNGADSDWSDSDLVPLSDYLKTPLQTSSSDINQHPAPSCSNQPENLELSPVVDQPLSKDNEILNTSSFTELLPTPEIKTAANPRRKAINSSAQVVTRDLFQAERTALPPVRSRTKKLMKLSLSKN